MEHNSLYIKNSFAPAVVPDQFLPGAKATIALVLNIPDISKL